ncbi:gluconate 2-dehydrogenase subunit 3 family protein [Daejeonella oryzae]|uniref:gluconate 2-dehydrogenase subunit 3 family protein n=1 Tax=Daejeonella oryzae TaxID=1122943 RepID=UPI0004267DB6|nr:gluconate 2-dehydrogenase subunit 3 family protein [Daejeonella oryzae]
MDRREAITKVGWLLGGTIIGANLFLEIGCTPTPEKVKVNALFNQDQVTLLNEMGETILPATSTPGAKEANVGAFMAVMVQDCYTKRDQKIFLEGLERLDEQCRKENGKAFMDCTPEQRTSFFTKVDIKQKAYMKNKTPEQPSHYFRMIKELTLLGFFTSEVGATKALRYIAIPGKYDGDMPYKKGDHAWAT